MRHSFFKYKRKYITTSRCPVSYSSIFFSWPFTGFYNIAYICFMRLLIRCHTLEQVFTFFVFIFLQVRRVFQIWSILLNRNDVKYELVVSGSWKCSIWFVMNLHSCTPFLELFIDHRFKIICDYRFNIFLFCFSMSCLFYTVTYTCVSQ